MTSSEPVWSVRSAQPDQQHRLLFFSERESTGCAGLRVALSLAEDHNAPHGGCPPQGLHGTSGLGGRLPQHS